MILEVQRKLSAPSRFDETTGFGGHLSIISLVCKALVSVVQYFATYLFSLLSVSWLLSIEILSVILMIYAFGL